MWIDLWEAERLREEALGKTTEGLLVGMISYGTENSSMEEGAPGSTEVSTVEAKGSNCRNFVNGSYPFAVRNSDEKVSLVWREEREFGRPRNLGSAPARKLDFLLELMQPYPGDPANVL